MKWVKTFFSVALMNIPNQRHISLLDGVGSDFFCLRLLCTKEPQVAVKIQNENRLQFLRDKHTLE